MVKQTLLVSGMHCSNCVLKIESLEDELPGVKRVEASYVRGRVVVEFDESLITLEQIVEGVQRKGYTVRRQGSGNRSQGRTFTGCIQGD